MSAKIIDGKKIALEIKEELKKEAGELKSKGIIPGLAVIVVGKDPASQIYVHNKIKASEELGINSQVYRLEEKTNQEELLTLIRKLNDDSTVNGILVQLPVPKHLNEEEIIKAINPEKDVDCFHYYNVGQVVVGSCQMLPCTPAGIMELLIRSNIEITGKDCVVIGRSNIVGKPMASMLLNAGGTVTVCHSKTKDLKTKCQQAEILISAVGKPNFITSDMVKSGAVVIDVGINRLESGKVVGDVDFSGVSEIASAITPVPGGVGPMTIVMLMKNTILAARVCG